MVTQLSDEIRAAHASSLMRNLDPVTFVIARITDAATGRVSLLADSKETNALDERATRHIYTKPIQKVVILDDDVVVGFAGDTPASALKHLVSLRGHPVDDIVKSLSDFSAKWWAEKEISKSFVIAKRAPDPRLWMVWKGELNDRTDVRTAWIGDHEAFYAFSMLYQESLNHLDEEQRLVSSMQSVVIQGEISTVGGYVARVTGDSSSPFRFRGDPVHTAPTYVEGVLTEHEGSVSIRFTVPPDADPTEHSRISIPGTGSTFSALVHFVPESNTAWLHTHDEPWSDALKLSVPSLDDLIETAATTHGQYLQPPSTARLPSFVGLDMDISLVELGATGDLPEGVVSGSAHPRGVTGGSISEFQILMTPLTSVPVTSVSDEVTTDTNRLGLAVLDPDDIRVAELLVERTERNADTAGVRTVWTDSSGLVVLDVLVGRDRRLKLNIHHGEANVAGREPSAIIDAVEFLAELCSPNRLAVLPVSGPHRPDSFVGPIPLERDEELGAIARAARRLTVIQDHVPTQRLVMPQSLTPEQGDALRDASELLSGHAIPGTCIEFSIISRGPGALNVGDTYMFCLVNDLTIELDDTEIIVGQSATVVQGRVAELSDTNVTVAPVDNRAVRTRFTGAGVPSGTVLCGNPAAHAGGSDRRLGH